MTTQLSSDPWLTDAGLQQLADDLAARGYSIQPRGLDQESCARLLADAHKLDESGQLRPAGIGREGAEVSTIRGDRILWLEPGLAPATDGFLSLVERLRLHLNRHLYLGLVDYEGHLACYGPGAGYRKHLDRIKGSDARVLTLIAYLNPGWTQADGGQLRLVLPNGNTEDVMPSTGTLVAFLSRDYWHEVLPGRRERWAITGWFRQRARA
jgi:SM-20-related protein